MKTTRHPLATDILSRDSVITQDARIVNGYVDGTGNNQYVVKRSGTSSFYTPPTLQTGNGMYVFNNIIYFGMGSSLYKLDYLGNSTLLGVSGVLGSLTAIAGYAKAGFVAGNTNVNANSGKLYFTATTTMPYLFLQNKTGGYTYNISTGALVQITDTNFPPYQATPYSLVPGSVYTNNTVFVMDTRGRIYASGIEDPTTWGALNYISMTSEPELAVCLARTINYVVAFGTNYIEFFYYAGNPTGSPLSVNLSAKVEIGCANADSVVNLPNALAYIGTSKEHGRGVYIMNNLTPTKVSTKAIENYLNTDSLGSVNAFSLSIAGHTFYVMSLLASNVTFAYDLSTGIWSQMSNLDSGGNEVCYEIGNFVSTNGGGFLQNSEEGYIAKLTPTQYTDEGSPIPFRIVTPRIEGTGNNMKFFQSLEVIGDRPRNNNNIVGNAIVGKAVVGISEPETLNIRHTDDDYNSWSPYRTVDMSAQRPIIRQLGSSRRRAYEFYDQGNNPMRILGVDLLMREGTF